MGIFFTGQIIIKKSKFEESKSPRSESVGLFTKYPVRRKSTVHTSIIEKFYRDIWGLLFGEQYYMYIQYLPVEYPYICCYAVMTDFTLVGYNDMCPNTLTSDCYINRAKEPIIICTKYTLRLLD